MIKTQVSKLSAIFLGAILVSTGIQAAPTLSMKTSIEEVNGVRDIEAGNYQAGIRKLEAALTKTSVNGNRLPLLNNLCVAHVALSNLQRATPYCDEAVQDSNKLTNTIALNNRAVLRYLQDDVVAAAADLKAAQENKRLTDLVDDNIRKLERVATLAKN